MVRKQQSVALALEKLRPVPKQSLVCSSSFASFKMKLQRLFQSWGNLKSEDIGGRGEEALDGEKIVFWSFVCKARSGFVPLKQAFLMLQIQKKPHCGQKPHGMHLSLRGRGRENSSQAGNGFQVSPYSSAQLDHYKPAVPGLVVPAVLLLPRDLD